MKNSIIFILLLFLIVLFLVPTVSALKIMENNIAEASDGNGDKHEILLAGVTEDNACVFKIDGDVLVVEEHEEGKKNGIYIVCINDRIICTFHPTFFFLRRGSE